MSVIHVGCAKHSTSRSNAARRLSFQLTITRAASVSIAPIALHAGVSHSTAAQSNRIFSSRISPSRARPAITVNKRPTKTVLTGYKDKHNSAQNRRATMFAADISSAESPARNKCCLPKNENEKTKPPDRNATRHPVPPQSLRFVATGTLPPAPSGGGCVILWRQQTRSITNSRAVPVTFTPGALLGLLYTTRDTSDGLSRRYLGNEESLQSVSDDH